jgi:hypothetical protein
MIINMNRGKFKQELKTLHELFSKAESICKKVETGLGEGVIIPAINQLRYAGQHLVEACVLNEPSGQAAEITKAQGHCKRAIYDASEASVLITKKQFENYREEFKEIVIGDVVKDYSLHLVAHGNLKKVIGEKRAGVSKEEHYENIYALSQKMVIALDDMEAHEEELKKVRLKHRKEERANEQEARRGETNIKLTKTRIYIAICSLIVAIVGGVSVFIYKDSTILEKASELHSETTLSNSGK